MTNVHRRDLLTWPILGPFLKWRHARTAMQAPLLLIAGLMIFDGLVGPRLAPKNLATVGVWLHYRGLVVLALLVAGNLFCMACPFMLPRQVGRWLRERLFGGGRNVPAALRNKWLAAGLVLVFFFSYEVFSLWSSPWLTAWIAVGYFLVAFLVDTVFRGATFCKYVCPLGQFNFFGSLISPLEIKVKEQTVCAACRTKDCIRGSSSNVRGCELWLFQERKAGNMDCTFCLDCVHACPCANVGLITRTPTAELWTDPFRSGIGRFSQRLDLAALVVIFVFGSFINAFAMIRPVYGLRENLARWLGTTSPVPGLALIFVIGLVVLPIVLVSGAAWLGRAPFVFRRSSFLPPLRQITARYIYALVPLGFGMWLAHYSFHFLTGALTVVPVAQSFLADVGLYRGAVQWGMGPVVPTDWLFPIEAVFMYAGATGSLIGAFQIARNQVESAPLPPNSGGNSLPPRLGGRGAVLAAAAPWMILTLLLLAFGLWVLVQPMEMRGTFMYSLPGG
ncbi:MAG: FesM [Chloroflexi bacterium]|nr:FesM [Chloroflexota bacterium]